VIGRESAIKKGPKSLRFRLAKSCNLIFNTRFPYYFILLLSYSLSNYFTFFYLLRPSYSIIEIPKPKESFIRKGKNEKRREMKARNLKSKKMEEEIVCNRW